MPLSASVRVGVPAASVGACAALSAETRISPADAWAVLEANFVEPATIATLTDEAYPKLLRRLAKEAIAGGRTYDAVIAECAHHAGVETLLTFNRRHFEPPPEGLKIIDPSAA